MQNHLQLPPSGCAVTDFETLSYPKGEEKEGAFGPFWPEPHMKPVIIQMGVVLFDPDDDFNITDTHKVEYIKPPAGVEVSDDFQNFSGITEEMLMTKGVEFDVALSQMYDMLGMEGLILAFEGDLWRDRFFDRDALEITCELHGVENPISDHRWMNSRMIYMAHGYDIKQSGKAVLSFDLPMEGDAHDGLVDARNTVRALKALNDRLVEEHG